MPSKAVLTRLHTFGSSRSVDSGWNTIEDAFALCPLNVWIFWQSGIDHNLHRPVQDAIATIFEFGLKRQNDNGLESPTWLQ